MTQSPGFTAVVGVDGSANSLSALDYALGETALRGGGTVKAVMTWSYSPVEATSFGLGGGLPQADSMTGATEQALAAVLEDVTVPDGVEMVAVAREGTPAHVLLEEAESADIIVVGKRGHGGFLGLLIGSVASQIANHAPCPVVIVPAPGA